MYYQSRLIPLGSVGNGLEEDRVSKRELLLLPGMEELCSIPINKGGKIPTNYKILTFLELS